MYKIYDTKGFVVEKRDSGSDDLSYYIFTKDFGYISAKAYSVRLEKSKMSNFLQSLNLCNLSLTRGKGGWVLTGGSLIYSIYYKNGQDAAVFYRKLFGLITRLSIREEEQSNLFRIIESSLASLDQVEMPILEVFLYIKVLNEFGYINIDQIVRKIGEEILKENLSSGLILKIKENNDFLVQKVNESLSQMDL